MPRVWAEGTSAQVGIQLAITRRAATGLLALAWDLAVKLPRTSAALRDGLFDQDKAQVVASWCANLDQVQAMQAEAMLFTDNPDLATMTWTMIRDRIARAVMTIDPSAAKKRREQATRDARVEARLEQSGNMAVAAREIPLASALALDKKLADRARQLKRAGIKGTMDRLRVLAYLERWDVLDPFTVPSPEDGIGGGPIGPHDQDNTGQDARDEDTRDQDTRDPASADSRNQSGRPWPQDWPQTDGRDCEHRDDEAGDDHGNGPGENGDGGPGNDEPGNDGPGGNGPDGHGPDNRNGPGGNGGCGGGCACGGTPPGQADTRTSGTGTGDDSMAGWLHLTVPATTILDHGDRAGQLNKVGPVDADLARTLASKIARNGQSTVCVTITGPDGRPIGHACGTPARGDPARSAEKRKQAPPGAPCSQETVQSALTPLQPPGTGYGTWRLTYAGRDLDLHFETLDGPCDHRHQAAGHDPGKHLKHLTAVLHQECTFGTCRTPEHRTDYEHAIPWPHGRTCWCKCHPCCRTDHQHKQTAGWHVEGTGQPGHFTWTLPSGRTYPAKPTSYPI